MFQITLLRSLPPSLLIVLILLSSTTCSEISERECEFTRSEVAEWQLGSSFKPYLQQDIVTAEQYIESIELGAGGGLLWLNDICTTAPLTISAELSLNIKEGYQVYDRAYLVFRHKLGNANTYLRSVALARTSLDESYVKLEVHPFEYSALPLFSPEGSPGSLALSIVAIVNAACDEESEANTISEYWLNLFFRSAKITVEYTVH